MARGRRARLAGTAAPRGSDAFDGVDALAAGAAGHLHVFAAAQPSDADTVVFLERVEDDRARGHVDPERKGFGREEHLEQARGEHALDELLVDREHAGVVVADAVTTERAQFSVELRLGELETRDQFALQRFHARAFVAVEQVALAAVAAREALAVFAAEGEHEHGQLARRHDFVEQKFRARSCVGRSEGSRRAPPTVAPATEKRPRAEPVPGFVGFFARLAEIVEFDRTARGHVQAVVERHRPVVGLDHVQSVRPDLAQPRAELENVRNRGRKTKKAHRRRGEDQRLLPHRATLGSSR